MEKGVFNTIRYFAQFGYPPNFDEVYTFFPKQISKQTLQHKLDQLVEQDRLLSYTPPQYISQSNLYTIPQYSTHFQNRINRYDASQKKLTKINKYTTALARFPSIQMIGISGSVAMMNAREEDDIDLFITTQENQLWTGRLTALLLAQWYGIRRKRTDWKHVTDKVCLNLFFDRKDMVIPTYKRTYYVGHEILQFKPVVNTNRTYESFLAKNDWVFDMFPNSQPQTLNSQLPTPAISPPKPETYNLQPVTFLESLAKSIQLPRIRAHQTNEIITETQLWFFPDDYEESIELHV